MILGTIYSFSLLLAVINPELWTPFICLTIAYAIHFYTDQPVC